jgi:hypothetical protein
MFCLPDPCDYQACRDRIAVLLSEIEVFEQDGQPFLASLNRREIRRLDQLSQWLPKLPVPSYSPLRPAALQFA